MFGRRLCIGRLLDRVCGELTGPTRGLPPTGQAHAAAALLDDLRATGARVHLSTLRWTMARRKQRWNVAPTSRLMPTQLSYEASSLI
jgi:hypothetical protein